MDDETSTCTSADGTEDFGENPTRDLLTEGLVGLLKPTVLSLEESIKNTRYSEVHTVLKIYISHRHSPFCFFFPKRRQSQVELRNQIEILSAELQTISQNQQCPVDLDVYVKKLLEARRRITIVNGILQNAQVCALFE